jgi:hypothetical protein
MKKFKFKSITELANPADIATLRKQYSKRDLDRVYLNSLSSLLSEECEEGMTAEMIVCPKLKETWTPKRRAEMHELLAHMVALGMLPWRLMGQNYHGKNVYIALNPTPEIHLNNMY